MSSHFALEQFLQQKCKVQERQRKNIGNLQSVASRFPSNDTKCYFIKPGHFYISEQLYPEFIEKYTNAIKDGNVYTLAEKLSRTTPFYLDLDFKNKTQERKYNDTFLLSLLAEVWKLFQKFLKVDELEEIHKHAWIYEKDEPVYDKAKNLYKDGIHIVFPYIVVNDFIIQKMMEELISIVESEQLITWEDELQAKLMFDMQVKAWLLYGSTKPGNLQYKLTRCYVPKTHKFSEHKFSIDHIIHTSSMLYKEVHEIGYSDEISHVLEQMEKKQQENDEEKLTFEAEEEDEDNEINYVSMTETEAKLLIDMFSDERAEDYESWLNVGLCLKSINKNWFHLWDYFSSRSSKYHEKGNKKFMQDNWKRFKDLNKWHTASLKYWAKQDSPEEYKKVQHRLIDELLKESLGRTHNAVAKVVYEVLKDDFKCSDPSLGIWYVFRQGKYQKMDKTVTLLKKRIVDDVLPIYRNMANHYKLLQLDADKEQIKEYEEKVEIIRKLQYKLEDHDYKKKVIDESRMYFYDTEMGHSLEEEFDKNIYLVAFSNGVYDLDRCEFREGRREDMITKHMVCNYEEFNSNSTHIKTINRFFEQIFPDPEVREYVWIFLSTCLSGCTTESFHIFTGVGANGKSTLMDLMERAFGHNEDSGLACQLPVSLLTQKRAAADNHSSSLAKTIGKRFVVIQEPENTDHLNMGFIKELSGKDTIQARKIYKEPITFKPQFKMVMCCNDLPDVPYNDGGTWRRLKVVPFEAEFVDHPDPNHPYQFKKDNNFGEYLNNPKTIEAFAYLLVQKWKVHKNNKYEWNFPAKVNAATANYKKKNDNMARFIEDRIKTDLTRSLRVSDLTRAYQTWWKLNIDKTPPKSTEIHAHFESHCKTKAKNRKYDGFCLNDDDEEE